MLVAGPNMALLQQHQGFTAPQTKKQEQNTIQNLHGNFAECCKPTTPKSRKPMS
jgi:hypothetical protein